MSEWTLEWVESILKNTPEENNILEFKEEWPHSAKMEHTICAMANGNGGHILIGVDNNHRIVGIADFGEVNSKVSQIIGNCIHPPYVTSKKIVFGDGKVIIVLEVHPSQEKPVQASNGAFYQRMQGRNQPTPRAALADIFVLKDVKKIRKTKLKSVIQQSIYAIEDEISPGGALKNGNRSIVFEKLLLKEIMEECHNYPYFFEEGVDLERVNRIFRICNKCIQKWKEIEIERDVLLRERWGATYTSADGFIVQLQNKTRFVRDDIVSELTGLKDELKSLLELLK